MACTYGRAGMVCTEDTSSVQAAEIVSDTDSQIVGDIGMGMTESLAKDIMTWGSLRYTQQDIEEARNFLYPATTQDGLLVSQQSIDLGQYILTEDGNIGVSVQQVSVPPKPTYITPNFYPYEDCGNPLTAEACVNRNIARQSANMILKANADALYNRAVCNRNNALNINAGHPELARNCEAEFPLQTVPNLGEMLAPGVDIGTGIYPGQDIPATVAFSDAAPTYNVPTYNPGTAVNQPTNTQGNSNQVTASDIISAGNQSQGFIDQIFDEEALGTEIALGGMNVPLWALLAAGFAGLMLLKR